MSTTSGSQLDEDVYTVERIEAVRVLYGGKKEYFIKWLNYPVSDNTWESENNIIDPSLISDFEKRRKEERERKIAGGGYNQNDPRDKKKIVHKTLTELASSIRKGHDDKLEKELARKQELLRKKQSEEKAAQARKLQKVLESTVEDDDHEPCSTQRFEPTKDKNQQKNKDHSSFRKKSKSPERLKKPVVNQKKDVNKTLLKEKWIAEDAKPKFVKVREDKPKVPESTNRVITDVGIDALLGTPVTPTPPPHKTGFDKGYKVMCIVGVSNRKSSTGGLQLLVQWDNGGIGPEEVELVPMDILRVKEPAMLIEYLQANIRFHSADALTSDSSSSSSSDSSSDDEERDTDKAPTPCPNETS